MKISIVAIGLFMAFTLVVRVSEAVPKMEDLACNTFDCNFPHVCEFKISSYCMPGLCPIGYACCSVGCGSKCINKYCHEPLPSEYK
eukprot:gene13942-15397_t